MDGEKSNEGRGGECIGECEPAYLKLLFSSLRSSAVLGHQGNR